MRATREEGARMSETRLACRVADGVFSEHQVRLKTVDPERTRSRPELRLLPHGALRLRPGRPDG